MNFTKPVTAFFLQPISIRAFAAELLMLGWNVLRIALIAAITPGLGLAGMSIFLLSEGRVFLAIFSLALAIAWFKWLWALVPM